VFISRNWPSCRVNEALTLPTSDATSRVSRETAVPVSETGLDRRMSSIQSSDSAATLPLTL